jgi:hypothetical protein
MENPAAVHITGDAKYLLKRELLGISLYKYPTVNNDGTIEIFDLYLRIFGSSGINLTYLL